VAARPCGGDDVARCGWLLRGACCVLLVAWCKLCVACCAGGSGMTRRRVCDKPIRATDSRPPHRPEYGSTVDMTVSPRVGGRRNVDWMVRADERVSRPPHEPQRRILGCLFVVCRILHALTLHACMLNVAHRAHRRRHPAGARQGKRCRRAQATAGAPAAARPARPAPAAAAVHRSMPTWYVQPRHAIQPEESCGVEHHTRVLCRAWLRRLCAI